MSYQWENEQDFSKLTVITLSDDRDLLVKNLFILNGCFTQIFRF